MRACDTVAKRPFTSTHLMSPYYTERRPSQNLIYTVDYTFNYRSTKFICACSHTSVYAQSEVVREGNLKHFKIRLMPLALLRAGGVSPNIANM